MKTGDSVLISPEVTHKSDLDSGHGDFCRDPQRRNNNSKNK